MTDFDAEYGPFLVSPKSHKLTQVIDPDAHILDLTRPDADVEDSSTQESKFLLHHDTVTSSWELPGGEGWDVGPRIGSLQELALTQLGLEVPWMSYIEDIEAEDVPCRIYGFSDENLDLDGLADSGYAWFTKSELQQCLGESDSICQAIDTWQQVGMVRGKGKACHQRQQQFE